MSRSAKPMYPPAPLPDEIDEGFATQPEAAKYLRITLRKLKEIVYSSRELLIVHEGRVPRVLWFELKARARQQVEAARAKRNVLLSRRGG